MLKKLLSLFLTALFISLPAKQASAEPMKEFVTSCTYGVLAGTLVGAATLAFTKKPGDNLNNIARGASLGLYAGILLGAYVVYGVPSGEESYDEEGVPETSEELEEQVRIKSIYPMISDNKIDGAGFIVQVLSF